MLKKSLLQNKAISVLANGIWDNNAIFAMVLGMCSSLAVTTTVINAVVMSLSVIFVLVISSTLISLLRKIIPEQIRLIVFMMVIATFVITTDFVLKIVSPEIASKLGPYVGLIITNCILMGRAEAYAVKNPVGYSFMDALGSGIGYGIVILLIAFVRELLSSGTIANFTVIPAWSSWGIMGIAPGAFFVLAGLTMLFNLIRIKVKGRKEGK